MTSEPFSFSFPPFSPSLFPFFPTQFEIISQEMILRKQMIFFFFLFFLPPLPFFLLSPLPFINAITKEKERGNRGRPFFFFFSSFFPPPPFPSSPPVVCQKGRLEEMNGGTFLPSFFPFPFPSFYLSSLRERRKMR